MQLTSFFAALQFLSIIPVRRTFDEHAVARSLLYFPLVGGVIGTILLVVAASTQHLPMLASALVVITWAIITGGLHLDGLADCADAFAVRGDRQRTQEVMKDPRCGPFAVVILTLILLVKFAALVSLFNTGGLIALLIAPVLGRSAVLLLYQTTPYVRAGGLGQVYADHLDSIVLWVVIAVSVGLSVLLIGLVPVLIASLLLLGLRWMMLQKLGGISGDTLGASIELVEACVLMGVVLV